MFVAWQEKKKSSNRHITRRLGVCRAEKIKKELQILVLEGNLGSFDLASMKM